MDARCLGFSKKHFLYFLVLLISSIQSLAQKSADSKSTSDLFFLIGDWNIKRTYSPTSDSTRFLNGTLTCKESLDSKFIKCMYIMERPQKKRAVDLVYFNYNTIYKAYESLWLSSTWPIKVLMQGQIAKRSDSIIFNSSAEFLIENGITEFVKGELILTTDKNGSPSFIRQTHIRTDREKKWLHHMTEKAMLLKK